MTGSRRLLVIALCILASAPLGAQRVGPAFGPALEASEASQPPVRLAAELGLAAAVTLAPATEGARDALVAVEEWNRGGGSPIRQGFVRALPRTLTARLGAAELGDGAWRVQPDGDLVWTIRLRVRNAHRVRLRLTDVHLPPRARLWVAAEDGEEVGPFGHELVGPGGDLWTPSVGGELVTLEIRLPAGSRASFELLEVLEIVQLDRRGAPLFATLAPEADESCMVDGRCVSSGTLDVIDAYRHAVARLEYVSGFYSYLCSGGLLNDSDPGSSVPYLLTANHCIGSQSVAITLEAFWDYYSNTCDGSPPGLGSVPKSNGSTLLATGAATDFSLLLLNSVPGGRLFLGWDANAGAVTNGTLLHRLSHPFGYHQMYSTHRVDTTPSGTCIGVPTSSFFYSNRQTGATFGGSSGAPVILPGGVVVGQNLGSCGPNNAEPCAATLNDYKLDGRFSGSYPAIAQYLSGPASGPCVQDATTFCLLNGRFRGVVGFRNGFDNNPVDTFAFRKPVTGFASSTFETAFFYFNDVNNIEGVLAMLDQGNVNGSGQPTIAVKLGIATPLRIEVTITDTNTGAVRTYSSAFGSQKGLTDFTAFVK